MGEVGVKQEMLKEMAVQGKSNLGFRQLMKEYHAFAEYYRHKARQALNKTSAHLEPRYQLSLEILYSLYLQIFERIDIVNGNFTPMELNPTPQEVHMRIYRVVSSFGIVDTVF